MNVPTSTGHFSFKVEMSANLTDVVPSAAATHVTKSATTSDSEVAVQQKLSETMARVIMEMSNLVGDIEDVRTHNSIVRAAQTITLEVLVRHYSRTTIKYHVHKDCKIKEILERYAKETSYKLWDEYNTYLGGGVVDVTETPRSVRVPVNRYQITTNVLAARYGGRGVPGAGQLGMLYG